MNVSTVGDRFDGTALPAARPDQFDEDELRLSPEPILALFILIGVGLVLIGELQPAPMLRVRLQTLALFLYAAAALGWLLKSRLPKLTSWLITLTATALIVSGVVRLGLPALATLLFCPVVLGLVTLGRQAAAVLAVIATAWLRVWQPPGAAAPGLALASLAAIWLTFGLVYWLERSTRLRIRWSWSHYAHGQRLLEEARGRSAELDQALEQLMHANRQLDLLAERLDAARMVAEGAQRTKADFVAKVSHEFRTPLNMIIG